MKRARTFRWWRSGCVHQGLSWARRPVAPRRLALSGHYSAPRSSTSGRRRPTAMHPDDEKRWIEEQAYIFHEKLIMEQYEMEKGKDMPFREDIEKIDKYEKAIASWDNSIFYIKATAISLYLCLIATKGVKLASRVMDSAALRLDKQDEISSCTTKRTLAMYVSIFVKLAKDTYDRQFNDQSIFSLLGAFKGVAAVGHILLQDALANVDYDGYSDSLVLETEDSWHEFRNELSKLEDEFRAVSKSTKAYEIQMGGVPSRLQATGNPVLRPYGASSGSI